MKKKKNKYKEIILSFIERYGPVILGVISLSLMWYFSYSDKIGHITAFDNILNSTITFGSITVGFVGALLGLLFSIRNTEAIDILFSTEYKEKIKSYFKYNIINGIALVFVSMLLFAVDVIDRWTLLQSWLIRPSVFLYSIWAFLLVYVLASSYRIINIIMFLIFDENQVSNKELPAVEMDNYTKSDLKEKFKK